MTLNDVRGWVRAILVIGYRRWRLEGGGWWGLWLWVRGGVNALAVGWRGAMASVDIRARRIVACRACPLFDEKLMTCGSMDGEVDTVRGREPVGCGCFMPMKVRFEGSQCWLDERDPESRRWRQPARVLKSGCGCATDMP